MVEERRGRSRDTPDPADPYTIVVLWGIITRHIPGKMTGQDRTRPVFPGITGSIACDTGIRM